MVSSKHAFWIALVFTLAVFIFGLVMGFFLETQRAGQVQKNLIASELNMLDEQLRNRVNERFNISCESSVSDTFNFAERIFHEAAKMETYDASSNLDDTLKLLHKRYDLLRLMLWTEAIELKQKCSKEFHIAVYIYAYGIEDISKKSMQSSMERLLIDFKNKYGDEILLIPIAGNLELGAINKVLDYYEISADELPVVVIDEKIVLKGLVTFDELEKTIIVR